MPADRDDPVEVLALGPEVWGELVVDVGPVDVVSVGDWTAPVEPLVLDELELSVCP